MPNRSHAAVLVWLLVFVAPILAYIYLTGGWSAYQRDLAQHENYCSANIKSDPSQNEMKECKTIIYRSLDDPVAIFTGLLVIATIALFIVTGLLYQAAVRQGSDARQALAVAQEANQIALNSRRPFVSAPIALIDNCLVFRNIGQTPTVGLYIDARPTLGENESMIRDVICKRLRSEFGENNPYSLMPNSDCHVDLNKMVSGAINIANPLKVDDWIAGGVVYRSKFSPEIYTTGFIARVVEIDGKLALSSIAAMGAT